MCWGRLFPFQHRGRLEAPLRLEIDIQVRMGRCPGVLGIQCRLQRLGGDIRAPCTEMARTGSVRCDAGSHGGSRKRRHAFWMRRNTDPFYAVLLQDSGLEHLHGLAELADRVVDPTSDAEHFRNRRSLREAADVLLEVRRVAEAPRGDVRNRVHAFSMQPLADLYGVFDLGAFRPIKRVRGLEAC